MTIKTIAANNVKFKIAYYESGDTVGKSLDAKIDAEINLERFPNNPDRTAIFDFQKKLADLLHSGLGVEVECPLIHHNVDGVWARTIFIPAGTYIVGKIHKHSHLNILSQGEVTVRTEAGGVENLKGPLTMISKAGTKRALFAHTDLVWTTIHVSNKDTPEEMLKDIILDSYDKESINFDESDYFIGGQ
jgi:hypothetical protein